ncbi:MULTISPECIES: adenosylmethionine--8-amino-7-oxononanoate transaminase [Candidatus Nitrosocaldus]|jgi:adenosylmethionine-8-amino-7-oxononanoate aminotransferase|uniref:Adenosylmethionine-8-amino-7-oxononanoate aminotransferase n=1 Tax=Candidatus Nitrosocaldus cavascurensis TaxID=2058097 RepID=A0A2K5ASF4_9ARCH|nr:MULTISPECIES: adenosylmethionine--8-amino-7-oxononanoate transaminase [Candidatus Nitrosocaldus]SPC34588.1 Adenosylmethionine-8-amino-7-oxononanoate aminotransferase [Candidatus Nitrosocaldus cavascurensis]
MHEHYTYKNGNLKTKDKAYVWHPYTQMSDWFRIDAPVIVRGEDFYLIDDRGNRYLDGVASMWCNVWGHSRKEIVDAIVEQAKVLQHSTLFGLCNEPSIVLAELLVKMTKGMGKVFYSDDGSTAMEVAIKMAIQYWYNKLGSNKRREIIALENGYHGDTIGAMSIGYIEHFFKPYKPLLFKVRHVPSPYLYRKSREMSDADYVQYCIDMLEHELKRGEGRVAAVVMESGAQIAGGVIVYPDGYQREVSRLCKRYDTLLVLDEVATGLGRLGSMVEYIAQDSMPDIVAFGKMLTAGYLPLAATLASDEIFNAFLGKYDEGKHLFHGHTFTGNPIACACAVANLRLYEQERLISKVKSSSALLAERLEEFRGYPIVGDVRHKGMLAAIELVKGNSNSNSKSNSKSKDPLLTLSDGRRINYAIMEEALKRGLFIRPLGHIMLIVPPLAIGREELNMLIDKALEVVGTISKLV